MSQEEYQIFEELDIGSDGSVYPGHPITVAYLITRCFPNYEAAFAKSENSDYSNALSSSKIPGAGGNVRAAMELLHNLRDGTFAAVAGKGRFKELSSEWEAAMKWADDDWRRCDGQADGGGSWGRDDWKPRIGGTGERCSPKEYYIDRWRRGQEQADKIKPLLEERDFWWWDTEKEEITQ